jgi:glycosyltransferase involved in cell wall biosynthesis
MTFCIITHVPHVEKNGQFYAYSPYVNEMNIWLQFADKVIIVAPKSDFELNSIHASYQHATIQFVAIEKFHTLSFAALLNSIIAIPINCWRIFKAMQQANHIHLRCPGNIGLLGSCVQIAFPKKKKTAKYAGNWNPQAKQPLSYRFQKWLLNNTFLTKNMQVLVYGKWSNQSKNIKPFFTATYNESDKIAIEARKLTEPLKFIFVGTLAIGKQPLYAIQLVQLLHQKGFNVKLAIYGEGVEKEVLQSYINDTNANEFVHLEGNITKQIMQLKYQESHFLLLPSKSEGWPKVVAEAMFWGCLPVVTPVSCVPFILDYGKRGVLLNENVEENVMQIQNLCQNQQVYNEKVTAAIQWSRQFTTDVFESEIKKMM